MEQIPITSNLFKDSHAMETPRKPCAAPALMAHGPSTDASAPPATESPAHQYGAPLPYGFPYASYPFMPPQHTPYVQPGLQHGPALGYLNPFGHAPGVLTFPHSLPANSQHPTFGIASSSPPPTCKLDDYCEACGHNPATRTKLEALSFEPGNTLDKIPSTEYEKVGFKYLEWACVVKADKAHRLLAKA